MRGPLRSLWQLEGTHTSCCNLRNTLRFPLPCELRPDSPAVTPEHSRACPHDSNGDLTSLRQHERLPEFPVVPGKESQVSSRSSRQTSRCPHQPKMRPFSLAAPREQSQVPSENSRESLTPIRQLSGAQRSPSQLKMKAQFPSTARLEPRMSQLIRR